MTYMFGHAASRREAISAAQQELEEIREVRAMEEAVLAELQAEVQAFERIKAETAKAREAVEATRYERKMLKLLPPPVYGGTEGLLAAAREMKNHKPSKTNEKVA